MIILVHYVMEIVFLSDLASAVFFFLMLIVYAIHNISTYFRDVFRFLA